MINIPSLYIYIFNFIIFPYKFKVNESPVTEDMWILQGWFHAACMVNRVEEHLHRAAQGRRAQLECSQPGPGPRSVPGKKHADATKHYITRQQDKGLILYGAVKAQHWPWQTLPALPPPLPGTRAYQSPWWHSPAPTSTHNTLVWAKSSCAVGLFP